MCLLRIHQTKGAFFDQLIECDAIDEIDRVEHVPFRFAHLLTLAVADQAMHIDILEWNVAGEVIRHHHHACDPEEDNVKTGNEHAGRQIARQHGVVCIGGGIAGPV